MLCVWLTWYVSLAVLITEQEGKNQLFAEATCLFLDMSLQQIADFHLVHSHLSSICIFAYYIVYLNINVVSKRTYRSLRVTK